MIGEYEHFSEFVRDCNNVTIDSEKQDALEIFLECIDDEDALNASSWFLSLEKEKQVICADKLKKLICAYDLKEASSQLNEAEDAFNKSVIDNPKGFDKSWIIYHTDKIAVHASNYVLFGDLFIAGQIVGINKLPQKKLRKDIYAVNKCDWDNTGLKFI